MTVSLLYSTETGFLASPHLLSQNTQYIMEREQTPDDAQVAMISGPLSPSPTFFATHYEARIINALNSGHYFVIGPSFGIDRQALRFILERLSFGSYPDNETSSRVAVFFFQGEEKFRKNAEFIEYLEQNHVEIVVAGRNHTERDAAMTAVSDYDILHYLSESECKVLYGNKYKSRISGTEMNELRRLEMEKQEGKAKQIVTSLEVSPDRTF